VETRLLRRGPRQRTSSVAHLFNEKVAPSWSEAIFPHPRKGSSSHISWPCLTRTARASMKVANSWLIVNVAADRRQADRHADHGAEIRAHIRDPDGHLIEVGQSTRLLS
jgi:hypothetical protein